MLFVEPRCLSMVRDDWARLLPDDARVAEVAAASRPALALVADLAAEGRLHFRAGGRALLHSHCHEKALGFAAATRAALGCVPGLEVDDPDAGCCGMSGVFGYEADHYELSVAMAERALLPAVRAGAAGDGRAGDRHVVPVADRRPRRPRRRPPARVPRRTPQA